MRTKTKSNVIIASTPTFEKPYLSNRTNYSYKIPAIIAAIPNIKNS